MAEAKLTPGKGDPLVGTIFEGRFEIISVLGQGGMGMVYKARHVHMDKIVALKTLTPIAVFDENSILRFEQEAKAAAALTHPNIISIFDFGRSSNGLAYLVMEFLQGKTLEDLIVESDEPMRMQRFQRIFSQVCEGMQHAHKKGVIHRDLKPSNLMVMDTEDETDLVKIVDFGLAKLNAGQSQQHLTHTGMVMGSPPFMSPEQCKGAELDPRSDIYSLGCVMYATITERVPHMGENSMATIYKHLSDAPQPISEAAPHLKIPAALEQVVMQTLEKDPNLRPQSMAELGKLLTAAINGEPLNLGLQPVTNDLQNIAPIAPVKSTDKTPKDQSKPTKNAETNQASRLAKSSEEPLSSKPGNGNFKRVILLSAILAAGAVVAATLMLQKHPTTKPDSQASTAPKDGTQAQPVAIASGKVSSPNPNAETKAPAEAKSATALEEAKAASEAQAAAEAKAAADAKAAAAKAAAEAVAEKQAAKLKRDSERLQAIERADEARTQANQAFTNKNYAQSEYLFKKCLEEEKIAYGAKDPHLLPTMARLLSSLNMQEKAGDCAALLQSAISIFDKDKKKAIEVAKEPPQSAVGTWRPLAYACYEMSRITDDRSKGFYAKHSETFYDLADKYWDRPKDTSYTNMLRNYIAVASLNGNTAKAEKLKQQMASADPSANPDQRQAGQRQGAQRQAQSEEGPPLPRRIKQFLLKRSQQGDGPPGPPDFIKADKQGSSQNQGPPDELKERLGGLLRNRRRPQESN